MIASRARLLLVALGSTNCFASSQVKDAAPDDPDEPGEPADPSEGSMPPGVTGTPTTDTELTLEVLDTTVALTVTLDQLLGQTSATNERLLGAAGNKHAEGWVRHGRSWGLRYEDQCAVEVAIRLPGGLMCGAALAGIGSTNRGAPLRRSTACLWPENSIKHSLGPGLAGLDLQTGLFRAWLAGGTVGDCKPA